MIKRTYFLKFERYRVNGNPAPSWKVIKKSGFFKPDLVKMIKDVVKELETEFPNEEFNLLEFKQI